MTQHLGTALAVLSLFCLTNFAQAASDSTSLDITAEVTATLSLTADLPALTLITAASDINVGSITIQSNDPDGFSLGFRSTSGGSDLLDPGALTPDPMAYTVWFDLQGTLPGAEPAGPFTYETAAQATGAYAGNTYNFSGGGTSVTYGVNLILPGYGSVTPGTYEETLEFELNDL